MNDKILMFYGGDWDHPPAMEPGWHRTAAVVELRQEAREIVETEFAGRDLWAWKDPRSSLTLPLWQDLLPQMMYVICLRNPLDVASSLFRRDSFSFEKSGRLWLTYTASAIAHTSGLRRLFVFYEDLVDDWRAEVARIAGFLDGPGWMPDEGALESIGEFVDRELEHHRTPLLRSLTEPAISFHAQALYLLLRWKARDPNPSCPPGAKRSEDMDALIDVFSRLCLEADSKLTAAKGEAAELNERLSQMTRALEFQGERHNASIAELAGRLSEKDLDLAALSGRLSEKDLDLAALSGRLESLSQRRVQEDRDLAALSDRLESMSHQLIERENQVAGMQQSVSWRWTAPLRQAKGWIRSHARRK